MNKIFMLVISIFLCFNFKAIAQNFVIHPDIFGGIEEPANSEIALQSVMLVGKINNRGTFYCSGTIISENMILTAAHCLGGNLWADLIVHFKTRLNGPGSTAKVIDRRAALDKIPNGKEFDWGDVAVVKIEGKIPANYRPAKLAEDYTLKDQDEVILAGYGKNIPTSTDGEDGVGVLRSVHQNVISSQYGNSELLVSLKDRGACNGDSGGPAFIQTKSGLVQVGITSRMTKRDIIPGSKDKYACLVDLVYSQVPYYLGFIREAVQSMSH